jgi:hypothetical protein
MPLQGARVNSRLRTAAAALFIMLLGAGATFAEVTQADAAVTPFKGGPAGACSMMKLNDRLHTKMCNPRLLGDSGISARCAKMAAAAGFVAAGSVAVATTPLDWPGVFLTGTFTWGSTVVFCQADWL